MELYNHKITKCTTPPSTTISILNQHCVVVAIDEAGVAVLITPVGVPDNAVVEGWPVSECVHVIEKVFKKSQYDIPTDQLYFTRA